MTKNKESGKLKAKFKVEEYIISRYRIERGKEKEKKTWCLGSENNTIVTRGGPIIIFR